MFLSCALLHFVAEQNENLFTGFMSCDQTSQVSALPRGDADPPPVFYSESTTYMHKRVSSPPPPQKAAEHGFAGSIAVLTRAPIHLVRRTFCIPGWYKLTPVSYVSRIVQSSEVIFPSQCVLTDNNNIHGRLSTPPPPFHLLPQVAACS
jgi:hypothetical protein